MNTATNDYAAIVIVAVGDYQDKGECARAATSFKVGSPDLGHRISHFSNTVSCL